MARGSIETLRTGFRARVYAGKDPPVAAAPRWKVMMHGTTATARQTTSMQTALPGRSHPTGCP